MIPIPACPLRVGQIFGCCPENPCLGFRLPRQALDSNFIPEVIDPIESEKSRSVRELIGVRAIPLKGGSEIGIDGQCKLILALGVRQL